jgi:3-phytase
MRKHALVLLGTLVAACSPPEDAIDSISLEQHMAESLGVARATVETPPLFDDEAGGDANADDPAIWVHPTHPGRSLILGTKKNAGLGVYDLAGHEVQAIRPPAAPGPDDEPGRFNNVDIVRGLVIGGKPVDVAVTTDRGRDQLRFYRIDPRGAVPLTDITAPDAPLVFSADQAEVNEQATAYGLAVTQPTRKRGAIAFATRRHRTEVAALAVVVTRDGHVSYRKVATLELPGTFTLPDGTSWKPCESSDEELPQAEGMVVDDENDALFIGQEDVGIWRASLDDRRPSLRLVDKVREFGVPYDRVFDPEEEEFTCTLRFDRDPGFGGKHLSADAEGVAIYKASHDGGYLIASSQGDSTFAVYERRGQNRFLGSFQIGDGPRIDGVQHSDGAAVINVPLGSAFPRGLFVTQDGENTPAAVDAEGEAREQTNFKLVPWPAIANAFSRPLEIDTGR